MQNLYFLLLSAVLLLPGCSSLGVINNEPMKAVNVQPPYSVQSVIGQRSLGDMTLVLAFSGGGSRAAALAYGVLEELRDTPIVQNGQTHRLLDEVDVISSVSGGSFLAAYYGLNGDKTFKNFEKEFLRRNIMEDLIFGILNPFLWFSNYGRTEMAVQFYDRTVFKGATYSDLQRKKGPLILINATDLNNGVRFSFVQEYFNLLCSDISNFPIARAVAASSSVPVVFDPVVIENYKGCQPKEKGLLSTKKHINTEDPQLEQAILGLKSYFAKKDEYHYVHLTDGGINDNLGLRAIYEITELSGGINKLAKSLNKTPVQQFAVISVNASTLSTPNIGLSLRPPTIEESINAITDIQLHRYNATTLLLFKDTLKRWQAELSTPEKPVQSYFIEINFKDIKQPKKRQFFNQISTSFSLTEEQVNELIKAGRELLRNNPAFKRLIHNAQRNNQHLPTVKN